jgi:hypothetical protein
MKQQSITSLPLSPEEERRRRMIKYTIAMSVRVLCIVAMLFVHGWWLALCAAGAILLPYFAVVIANVHADPRGATVVRPGAVEVYRPDAAPYEPGRPSAASGQEPSARESSAPGPSASEPSAPEPAAPEGEPR